MRYPDYIDEIICRLEAAGETAYIVGGSLRDILIGTPPHDYDLTTSACPQKTLEIFSDKRVIETGIKHGTVTVIWDGQPVEITTMRVDGGYTDLRHPDNVSFTSKIQEDLARRDFTINAIAYNKKDGLVDCFDGRKDIEKRLLRAVGDPALRFSEDALRIMRAFRFSSQLGFDIERETLSAAVLKAEGLANIARERICAEFIKLITSPFPETPLALMAEHGILEYVTKGYIPSKKVIQNVGQAPQNDTARLAAVLFDTDEQSARSYLSELRCSGKQITGALATMRGAKMCVNTETDARQLIAVTGIYAPDAAVLSELMGVSPAGAVDAVLRQQSTPCKLRDLKINGKDIAQMGAEGKLIGATLDTLMKEVISDPSLNQRQTLLMLAQQILNKKGY